MVVIIIGLWTLLQALRKENSVFGLAERKLIWFWGVVGVVALLVAFGRFAPFYHLFYALPFASGSDILRRQLNSPVRRSFLPEFLLSHFRVPANGRYQDDCL